MGINASVLVFFSSSFLLFFALAYPTQPIFLSSIRSQWGQRLRLPLWVKSEELAQKAALQAFQEIRRIEYLMSPWIESSDVTRVNRSAGSDAVKVSPETVEVIKRAQEVSKLSGGGFDITVGPLVQLWRKARERGTPPEMEEVKETLNLVNFRNLKTHYGGKYR